MKNRILLSLLVLVLALSVGLVGCGGEEVQEYSLTISSTEGGSVTSPGEPGPYTYDEGEVVNLVAKADEGYQFASWTGDVSEIADVEHSTTLITIYDNYSITATFAVKQYNLVIHSTEGGSVTAPGEGAYTYDKGEVVNLVAVADEGYVFMNWTGDISTIDDVDDASTTVIMNGGYSITANFAKGIWDWYDLNAVRDNLSGTYVLMNDLDSNTTGYEEFASPRANGGKGWEPIGSILVDPLYRTGSPADPFTGSLGGQEYEIRDLFINRPDEDGVGLFGCVGDGVIQNVGMMGATVAGCSHVGSLVACAFSDSTISNSYCIAGVSGYEWVGGLIGGDDGAVSQCYSIGNVTGTQMVGGLMGGTWGSITASYSNCDVTGRWTIGGLVGWNHQGTVINSYSTGSVTGEGSVGGLIGQHHDGAVSNSHYDYDEVLINSAHIITIGALSNGDFDEWLANDRLLDINERLAQEDAYYLINDVNGFKELLAFGQDSSLKFRLTNNLDLGSDSGFYIPYLAGEFDGNGHKIRNLRCHFDSVAQVGLFGYLASGGLVTGVSVENADMNGLVIVGALVGENDGTVTDSYATGSVTGGSHVGGLVGWTGWHGGTVSNSYYNYGEVLINGRHVITIGALTSQDFDQWLANDKSLDISERLSREDGYYLISDTGDFKQLLAFGQDSTVKFRLKSDLDLGSESNFYIPYLAGEFDGNGHTISNLRLNFDDVAQVGLFGYLASGAKISEVGVENVNVAGSEQVGGLAGGSFGTVSNSYCTGSVTGGGAVGGLVGWNRGAVSNCYSSDSATADGCVGGLVGENYGGSVSSSYSTGRVSGGGPEGGLVGMGHTTVRNSFWDIQISGQSISDGGTGKTTAEMKTIGTFTSAGWDIVAVADPHIRNASYVWNIVDGQTYPFLSWQAVS